MRHPRTVTAGALALATAAVLAVPAAASADPAPRVEPATVAADVAAKVQIALGRDLCGPALRPVLVAVDDVRVLLCADPAVAVDLTAKVAVAAG